MHRSTGSAPGSSPAPDPSSALTRPAAPVLDVRGLRVAAHGGDIVRGVDLAIAEGEICGVIGESGCGKTTLGLAVAGLLGRDRSIVAGEVRFRGDVIADAGADRVGPLRGTRIAYVPQDPFGAFDPLRRVGPQVARPLRLHRGLDRGAAEAEAIRLLARLGVPEPEGAARRFPHEFSGGMLQRAAIAAALACRPDLVIADEPTSALDVIVRGQVLGAFLDLVAELHSSVLIVTHDLGILRSVASRVATMYAGAIVEEGPASEVLDAPWHPYPAALLASSVSASARGSRLVGIDGQPPTLPGDLEPCAFAPRCPRADARCRAEQPALAAIAGGTGRTVACHHPLVGSDA